jgi:hypothetical protein
LTSALDKLARLLRVGLATTASLFAPVRLADQWIHQAAHILGNPNNLASSDVRQEYEAFLSHLRDYPSTADSVADGIAHFLNVTASYAPNLFTCYDLPEIPRTNNDLEQTFGKVRHAERRVTGRKAGSPLVVVRGPVHVLASVVTSTGQFSPQMICSYDYQSWRSLRQEVEQRHLLRIHQWQFRRDPSAFLAPLEQHLSTPILPP